MIARGSGSTTTRRRRMLDCIAAVLITAVAGCGDDFPHPIGPDPTPNLTWQLSATGPLRSIWGDPSGEVFAVCGQGILHYDGSTWSNTSLPDEVLDIWGSSAEDVFAVGRNWSPSAGTHGSIFHFDGRVWTAMTTPTSQGLHAVWGSAANDVYAVGESATILHYDGLRWTLASSPVFNNEPFQDVWGSSSSDVFVTTSHWIYHYNGSSWSLSLNTVDTVIWIWGNAGDDVFVGGPWSGTVHHYDGHTWTPFDTGIHSDIRAAWGSSSNNMYFVGGNGVFHWDGSTSSESLPIDHGWLEAIWGRSPTDIFVGGSDFRHYDGGQWRQVLGVIGYVEAVGLVSDDGFLTASRPDEDYWETFGYDGVEWKYLGDINADISIGGIWGSSFSDIFAVGTHGNDGDGDGNGYDDGYIWHYDGVDWNLSGWFPSGLSGVWGTSGSDVFAVGTAGVILHYDGVNWSQMPSGTTISLNAVWESSSTDVFACGNENGATVILHYDGSAWSEMGRYGRDQSYGGKIWGSSGRDVYVLGLYGALLHYDGTTWSSVTLKGNNQIWDIWGRSRDDVYAATDTGILHYDGSTWRSLGFGTVGMRRLWGTRTDVFGTGDGGVYHLGPR